VDGVELLYAVHTNVDEDDVGTAQVVFEELIAVVDAVVHHMIHANSYDACLRASDMVNRFSYVVFMKGGVDVLRLRLCATAYAISRYFCHAIRSPT
jgi:hypothetical protein